MAYESHFYWKDWAGWLATEDERGHALFHDNGCAVMKTKENGYMATIMSHMDALGVPYENWDTETLKARMPHYDLSLYAPAKRPGDDGFGEGNFRALFESIEQDQINRGVLAAE